MRYKRNLTVCLLLALATISAIGCGGGDDGSDDMLLGGLALVALAPKDCRTYATRYNDGTNTIDCAFDASSNSLVCTSGSVTITNTYASIADFVDEAAATGRTRWQQQTVGGGTTVNTYDENARLTMATFGTSTVTYSGWDTLGRHTAGTMSITTCDAPVAVSYDDTARTMTQTISFASGTGAGCGSLPPSLTSTTTYDANGIIVSTATGGTTITNTIESTATVCK